MFLSEQEVLRARKTIEMTYDCLCDVIEYKSKKNEINKRTNDKEEITLKGKPCRISFKTINNTIETETGSNVTQEIKLFIAPELNIKSRFKT